ncbi:MAG: PA14 domain-containing protein [Chloroflexota bacterium]|nr:PA14 domain-containing protein [Chloroflexota bacterium]
MRNKWFSIALVITTLVLLVGVVPASAAPSESCPVHVVQRGETLYSIARRYGVDMWTIARANNITNPNRIYVGQRLAIPTGQPVRTIHVVQPGETLLRIALRYGVDAWTIARANGITNLNHIYVGQRLIIPGTAPPAPPPPPRPSPASHPGPWSGEYFDNVTLTGSAYTTREDESINFNWGYGPPAGGMPTNSFSVRWTGTFNFTEGTHRFYAKVDDGVRVYVDGERIIDGWRDGGLRLYTADRTLAAGDHTVQVEYYDRIQVARVYFWWAQLTGPTPTPEPTPSPAPAPGEGWSGQFYNNKTLEGDPVTTSHDPWIGFEWGTDSPMPGVWSDHFSARWTTKLNLKTDHYRFCAMSDDGVRIWVGGDLVLDEWHANNGVAYCGDYWAATGVYEVKVEYYEDGGDALIYMWWEPH